MARKSNKTAHVLNLLATGHDTKKENTPDTDIETSEVKKVSPEAEVIPETPEAPATPETSEIPKTSETPKTPEVPETSEAPASPAPQSVSVIDKTEEDPVAQLIHQKLLEELNMEEDNGESSEVEETPVSQSEDVVEATPEAASEVIVEAAPEPQSEAIAETAPEAASEAIAEAAPVETVPEPQSEAIAEAVPEIVPEPEPDFVVVNVIERIVRDKVIYFMREFGVCTCERCIADTVALALNGLPSKYIVTTPMAVDPLISFYTNKYISTVTVEVTKACMIVKENPRH